MTNLLDIRRRQKATANIAEILEAMQVITFTKIRQNQARLTQAKEYRYKLKGLLETVLSTTGLEAASAWLDAKDHQEQTLVAVLPAREGFASEFDRQLGREVNEFLAAICQKTKAAALILSKKTSLHLSLKKDLVEQRFWPLADRPSFSDAQKIGRSLANDYRQKTYRGIYFAYNTFTSIISQPPTIRQLLPLPREFNLAADPPLCFYEEKPVMILDQVLENYLAALIWEIMIESQLSELYTRLHTLRSATDNAKQLLEEITNLLNKTRQALITQELTNIFSSFLILKGDEEQVL